MRKAADKMKNPISPETKYNYFFIEKSDMKQENMRSNLELATDTEKTILCVHHNLNIQKVSWNPPSVTKKCLSVTKNHRFLNKVVNVKK